MLTDKNHIRGLLINELQGNLKILVDPKKKDSFSSDRIKTWTNLVTDRVLHHLFEENKK